VKYFGFTILNIILSVLGILLFVVLVSMGLMFLALTLGIKIIGHNSIQSVITLLTLLLFFVSNTLYQINSLPIAIQIASSFNPLSYFINGVRYFSIGQKFYSMGTYYEFGTSDMLVSLAIISLFTSSMYLLTIRTIKRDKWFKILSFSYTVCHLGLTTIYFVVSTHILPAATLKN
jgi:ABC-2 type transport system permease protein